ncbi:MAG TPA: amidohydrolase [Candidatus Sulfotelmatobacter sp.]|nr:amidohydrolase [Candidatus Sulfotelmatobacter sp.]
MDLVDTHQHIWDLDRFPYSWCAAIPALNRSFRFADYAAASAGLGIVKTVFVECDVDEPNALAEARMIQELADRHPSIAGIVAGGRPELDGFRAHVEQLARLKRVRGVRRILHTQPDGLSQEPRFAENLRLLPEFGFSFDLCVLARQLPLAIDLVRQCPEVSFILDHCGVPDVRAGALDPWRALIAEMASLPNVACKVSGLVAYADPAACSAGDLRPWIEHVIAQFGWDRVVWGGDWPVCTTAATLAQWVGATRELTRNASEHERARLFQANAERIYRI